MTWEALHRVEPVASLGNPSATQELQDATRRSPPPSPSPPLLTLLAKAVRAMAVVSSSTCSAAACPSTASLKPKPG